MRWVRVSVTMQTLRVIESEDGWSVEREGRVIFQAQGEERCFIHALETSSQMFDDGVRTWVILDRLN